MVRRGDVTPRAAARGWIGAALLALTWAALLAPALTGHTLWYRDLLIYTYPQKSYVLERLLRAELPWWCERWGMGRPFFALTQPGALDPLNAALLLPHPLNLDVYNLAHLLVLMFGARAWLRREGCDELDASAAGLMLGLSGYTLSMLSSNGTYAWGVAFVPWCLAAVAAARGAARPRELAAPTLGVTAAMTLGVLSGDPMSAAFAVGAGAAVALGTADGAARRRALLALALGAALAGLVCAAQLVPAAHLARAYRGGGVSLRDAETFSLPPRRMLELLVPDALGAPFSPGWQGPALYTRSAQQRLVPLAFTVHQGVLLLPLAALALRRRRRLDLALGALAAAALALSWGRFAGPWPWLFTHVPGVSMFRSPEKYVFVASLALAALAARGVGEARRAPAIAAGACAAMALGLALASILLPGSGALRGAAWALGYALVFGAAATRRVGDTLARALPVGVMAVELGLAAGGLLQWAPAEAAYARPPLLHALAADRGGDPRGAVVFRDLLLRTRPTDDTPAAAVCSLMPNLPMRDGVRFLDPYDAVRVTRLRSLRREVIATPALLRAWGATHAVLHEAALLPQGFTPLASDPDCGVRLARVEGAAPGVFLARDSVSVHGPEAALAALRAPGFRAGETAVVEGEARSARGRCALVSSRPERREFDCESDAPGWMHVDEAFDPSWAARANGAPTRVTRSAELFLAVAVPAGRSRVVLTVRVPGAAAGMGLSALGGAVTLWALGVAWRARRPRAKGVAPASA